MISCKLEREQAAFANTLGFEQEYELEEAMSLYDAESEGLFGLEDFELALLGVGRHLSRKVP